jgi:hypothetical protein
MFKLVGISAFVAIGLMVSGCSTTPPKVLEKTAIVNPTIDGYPVDNCMTWAKNCRKPVADYLCRQEGYSFSINHTIKKVRPTKLVTGKICDAHYCAAIDYVECGRYK